MECTFDYVGHSPTPCTSIGLFNPGQVHHLRLFLPVVGCDADAHNVAGGGEVLKDGGAIHVPARPREVGMGSAAWAKASLLWAGTPRHPEPTARGGGGLRQKHLWQLHGTQDVI